MAPEPTIREDILRTIAKIEARKQQFDELLKPLREVVRKMDEVAPELGFHPSADSAQPKLPGSRSRQFQRIATFFIQRKNEPATVKQIKAAVGMSRSALSNILYRTQKEAFLSERVPGERRLMQWRLKTELYQQMLAPPFGT